MEEELEEREMILRQKALNTLPQKRKGYRDKQGADFGIDALLAGESRMSHSGGSTSRDRHSHYPSHGSSRELRMPQDTSRGRAKLQRDGERQLRGRKASSSHSSSRSGSASVSYSSYSTSGSSTSGSRSRSSSSRSHSSYSSYTRSSYSSSRRSYSASPHPTRRTKKEHHSLHKAPHSDPRPKVSSKVPPHHRYPASSQWYEGEHAPAYASSRSPPRARKGHQPSRIPSHGSKDYGDEYPPAKRRPPADYPEYRRGPLPTERHRMHTPPPPPPPPPPVHRKERVVRHMRRSPLRRSPAPYGNRPPYSRGPPSPSPHYPTSHHGPRRRSPPPPTRPSHDTRPKRRLVSDRMPSRPSSRDLRSLCGPPIHVRDRLHHHSPDRRAPRLPGPRLERDPYRSGASASREHNPRESRRMGVERKRESYPPLATRSRVDKAVSGREYARRSDIHVRMESSSRKEKPESSKATDKIHVRYSDKEKTSADEQDKSSVVPSLVSPTAQLLWEDGEEKEEEPEEGGEVKVKVKVAEEGEEGEVEELDYDESMEDLDLHPTGNIDEGEGDEESRAHRLSVASDPRPGTMSWDDSEEGEREEGNEGISGQNEELVKSDADVETYTKRHEGSPTDGGALSEGSGTEDNVHISSPIRVSPERREPRVVQRSPRCEEDGRLSAKERLYVSKNAIEEKKLRMSRRNEDTASKLPRSLANRLGPSPGLRGRRSDRPRSGHKGSALAIAAEYKRKKQAGELSPREAARASMITKRINESEYKSDYKPLKHRKTEERSEENERELDRRIDSIKQRNKALEKRHKEIEKDKQLYG